jgi:hypothetical protein
MPHIIVFNKLRLFSKYFHIHFLLNFVLANFISFHEILLYFLFNCANFSQKTFAKFRQTFREIIYQFRKIQKYFLLRIFEKFRQYPTPHPFVSLTSFFTFLSFLILLFILYLYLDCASALSLYSSLPRTKVFKIIFVYSCSLCCGFRSSCIQTVLIGSRSGSRSILAF